MVVKGKLQAGQSVLIHGGCTPIGLAAISIASCTQCQIFVTVSTKRQKYQLIQDYHYVSTAKSVCIFHVKFFNILLNRQYVLI